MLVRCWGLRWSRSGVCATLRCSHGREPRRRWSCVVRRRVWGPIVLTGLTMLVRRWRASFRGAGWPQLCGVRNGVGPGVVGRYVGPRRCVSEDALRMASELCPFFELPRALALVQQRWLSLQPLASAGLWWRRCEIWVPCVRRPRRWRPFAFGGLLDWRCAVWVSCARRPRGRRW